MVMCFAPDCKHYSERGECKSFFRFPKNCLERRKWITLLRRSDREPTQYSLVCSCHFKDGDKTNGPTIFRHNVGKRFSFESFPKKRKTGKSVTAAADMTASVTEISSSPGEGVNTEIQRPEKVVVTEILPQAYDETELGQFVFVAVKENSITDQCDLFINEANEVLDVTQMMSEHNYCIPHNVVSDIIQKMGQPKNNDAEILRQKLCGRKIIRRTKRKKESVDVNDTTTTVDIEIVKKF